MAAAAGERIDCLVSLILPLQGEAEDLDALLAEVSRILAERYSDYEVVLVGDPSRQAALERAHAALDSYGHLRLIELTRPSETEVAISAGLDAVIGDFVVVLDPATDPPGRIPELVERCRAGSDVVYGVRRSRKGEPLWNKVFSWLFYRVVNRLLGLGIQPDATHLRAMSRRAVNALLEVRDRARFLRTLSSYAGFATDRVEYDPLPRRSSARSFGQSLRLAVSIVATNSVQPLRVAGLLGLVAALVNLLYVGYVFAIYAFKENPAEGWTTQSLQAAVTHAAVFLILAVLCEYVGRVVDEVMDRPLYFVNRERHSSALRAYTRRNVVGESVRGDETRPDGS